MAEFSDALNSLALFQSSLSQYVVTPMNAFGLGGFVFDIEGEARVELTNEITDHYVEDNGAIQDHIAVKPKKLTLRNYIGELVFRQDKTTDTPLQKAVQKLTVLDATLPTLAIGAQQAYNAIERQAAGTFSAGQAFTAATNTASNLYALVKNLVSSTNRQQAASQYFKALRDQKMLFSVQTPFEFMTNMAIETIIAIQPEDSIYISNFSITLKEIRTASTVSITVGNSNSSAAVQNPADAQGRLSEQAAPTVQNGIMAGVDPAGLPTGSPLRYPANIQDLMNTDGFKNALRKAQ